MPNNPEVKMEELKLVFDEFNTAIANGKLEEGVKVRTGESKQSIMDAMKTKEEKLGTEQMLKAMIPLSCTLDHLDVKDSKAILYMTATLPDPEKPTEKYRVEMMVNFAMDEGTWKMDQIMYLMNPDTIKRSPDQTFEPKENFDLNKNTVIGGRIVSVKFEPEYTLVAIRMLDEENLVFLPKKEDLEKSGVKTELLIPWKTLQVEGNPHKTNPLKILGVKTEFVEPTY